VEEKTLGFPITYRSETLTAVGVALGVVFTGSLPARAITFGQLDGNLHPNVGALMAEYNQVGQKDLVCSGTLISPTVFLTAAHCTFSLEFLDGIPRDQVWVTFAPSLSESPTLYKGTSYTDPAFTANPALNNYLSSDSHDIAVIVLDQPVVGITPAKLPTLGLLDQMKPLKNQIFTAVGYGDVRDSKTGGPNGILDTVGDRRYATQSFLALRPNWLQLSQNPSKGNGGTCFGDSGGPNFLGSSNVIVSITSWGDAACRATSTTYRLDTESAISFLSPFLEGSFPLTPLTRQPAGNFPELSSTTAFRSLSQQSVESVPEPSSHLNLLALGILGAGAALKRQLKP
jgi:Trypsin